MPRPCAAPIPIIFLTAHDDTEHKLRAFGVRGRDYVTKPFEVDEVLARVRNQLRIADLERDLRKQNEALNDANAKLVEASAHKARVTAMLVHDLRNPLTVIGAILSEGVPDDESLQDARTAFHGVRKLLDEMLELSKSEAAQPRTSARVLELGELISRSIRLNQYIAEQRQIHLSYTPAADPLLLHGDSEQLERVLLNLIGNAFKFTPPGGRITLSLQEEAGAGVESGLRFACVKVMDTGTGITPEELPFVFDAYRQGKLAGKHGGVGLGLAIVARIVASHGGRVRVLSQLGVGTEFHVLLPL